MLGRVAARASGRWQPLAARSSRAFAQWEVLPEVKPGIPTDGVVKPGHPGAWAAAEANEPKTPRNQPRAPALVMGLLMASMMFWRLPPFMASLIVGSTMSEDSTIQGAAVAGRSGRGDGQRAQMPAA
ncbi:unnamed protein product [Polarella glacialis]|uniref:Uncharacterized protein n=1 Tax=Polarella glacialis TaxID=89957 RepID=A0A813EWE6_POLGL|nr:unnamed protein product [Polarella glacialis]